MIFMMVQVKWDIHELLSQHNQYVDMLLQVGPCSTYVVNIIVVIIHIHFPIVVSELFVILNKLE